MFLKVLKHDGIMISKRYSRFPIRYTDLGVVNMHYTNQFSNSHPNHFMIYDSTHRVSFLLIIKHTHFFYCGTNISLDSTETQLVLFNLHTFTP